MSEHVPEGHQAWLLRGAETGIGMGMRLNDPSLSTSVFMDLWCYDLDRPGRFAMSPDQADRLAEMLRESAAKARKDMP